MADQEDVRRIARALPGATEGEERFGFSVEVKGKQKGFVWLWNERVHPKKPKVPNPEVLALRVADLGEKDALLASGTEYLFTEPHYNGYPAVLVRLPLVPLEALQELIEDSWCCMASPALVNGWRTRRERGSVIDSGGGNVG